MTADKQTRRRLMARLRSWARRVHLERKVAQVLAVAAVISGLATIASMLGGSKDGSAFDPKLVIVLLYVDVILLLALGVIVARRLVTVWAERRRGLAGSKLHIRFVVMFSLVAVTPAILVAVFSALFLNFGVQAWFSERVRTAVEESRAVADAYLQEHRQNIRADALAIANDLNREASTLMRNPELFSRVLSTQAGVRGLSEALVVDGQGKVLARTALSFSLEFDLVPPSAMQTAARGEVPVLTSDQENRLRAVVKLNRFVDAYLLVGRFVEASVVDHIEQTEQAFSQYKQLEKQRKSFQISFVMIFVLVALMLLLAAIWIGLSVATQFAEPIRNLITAAERIRKGDLKARVGASGSADEIGTLSRAFNRMTHQLEAQQEGLMAANRELDERRRFTETVLAGVSAGVIGLDAEGRVHLTNRSAADLLATDLEHAAGRPLAEVAPEMSEALDEVMRRPDRVLQTEVRLVRGNRTSTLVLSIAAERAEDEVLGFVVTFDDITELLTAQRKAAWADVARRIAHEIKNPLTPIQLSAERLRRRWAKEVQSDPDTFAACVDTIVRQVGDIRNMVDEFSSFARMPQASLKRENLSEICRQAVFLERERQDGITYHLDLPEKDVHLRCDTRQITQALTNLLKNAAESILGRESQEPPGEISLDLARREGADGTRVVVWISDNGRGLPADDRDRLTEPYVTTREKGTGLGLAIVKKIMEDHEGDLVLEDRQDGGARVSLVFPAPPDEGDGDTDDAPADPMTVATGLLASNT